jgi:hypothetical protein
MDTDADSTTALRLQEIAASDAADLLRRQHYLGNSPTNAAPCFGMLAGDLLYAAALYGPLHMPKGPVGWLELRRLVRAPDFPGSLSAFLAATLRELKSRGVPAVLTWADPAAGHHGGIYQATNWVFNEPRSYNWNSSYKTESGAVLTHRDVFKLLGTSAKAKVLALRPGWTPFLPLPKYRYVMPLNISKRDALVALGGIEKPYPKPAHEGAPQRPAHAQRSATI